jgi:pimeloyl-ACP methyl ester carboxylesterase
VLGQKYRAYSIDLLGYGFSDKPDPRGREKNELYCFETWARQIEGGDRGA